MRHAMFPNEVPPAEKTNTTFNNLVLYELVLCKALTKDHIKIAPVIKFDTVFMVPFSKSGIITFYTWS
jgi:hypothetical protein